MREQTLLEKLRAANHPFNLPPVAAKLTYKTNRKGFTERCEDPSVRKSMDIDLELVGHRFPLRPVFLHLFPSPDPGDNWHDDAATLMRTA